MMSGIKNKNTKPELLIRKGLHANGFRFRLHDKKLPGRPDLVLSKYKAIIQVNGCFWHGHKCHLFKWPQSRRDFWHNKISGNIQRDTINKSSLEALDWRLAIIWECSLKGKHRLEYDFVIETIALWLTDMNRNKLELRGNE